VSKDLTQGPTIIAIDDAAEADTDSIELLRGLMHELEPFPLAIVFISGPDLLKKRPWMV